MELETPDGWNRVQSPQGDELVKQFDRGDFAGSVGFVDAILPLAEAAEHHPDVRISWKDVTITLFTHSDGRVTERDIALAREIDGIA